MDARTDRTLLILEDGPFIALDVADALRNTTYNVVTLRSFADAMNWRDLVHSLWFEDQAFPDDPGVEKKAELPAVGSFS
ncbi:hypothetical protein LJR098_002141 [Rhizobium sp. LjRoot98]|uniref:hypothetical protein n=1 Tax=unclassified Rhizobium TaxID=2613769 RepID=UPI0007145EA2|nr:hypothetical protein [Rhizobium sp. Root1204]KQV33006.1 hypothetical protein ASC96_30610 [Rhizobium sp. Root1204]